MGPANHGGVVTRLALALPITLGLLGCGAPLTEPESDAAVMRRDAHFDAFVLPAVVPTSPDFCASPAHCDDGDPCTIDECHPVSPVRFEGTCTRERIEGCITPPDAGRPDAGRDAATTTRDAGSGPENPVDPLCRSTTDLSPVLLPYVPFGAPDVAGCEAGIEWQNCSGTISLSAASREGARARTLVVDIATYTAADRLRIHGIDGSGAWYVLLDTCRIRTAEWGDPTDGRSRPPEEMIRRFEVELREGTRALTLDATAAPSPWYMRVLGLCELTVDTIDPGCAYGYRDSFP